MDTPKKSKHISIILVKNYSKIDGKFSGDTDAVSLSIGKAQYDNNDISAKVFRRKNGKWLRQSEELPLHRVLDLSILTISSLMKKLDKIESTTNLNEEVIEPPELNEIQKYFEDKKNRDELTKRIDELQRVIEIFKK